MPHQCTDCGTVFDDGSTEMLSGCPECGGNTFQFLPDREANSTTGSPPEPESQPPERPNPTDSVAHSVGNAAKTVRDLVRSTPDGPGTDPESADPLSRPDDGPAGSSVGTGQAEAEERPVETSGPSSIGSEENDAQASARSDVVSTDELPERDGPGVAAGSNPPQQSAPTTETTDEGDRPDLETLREELNDQFESIRIVEPGQYELNLMELYEREEYIIALQEDGRYRIQVPESW